MAVAPERLRFTVDEYYRMAAAGILAPDDRLELIEGEIYKMSPIGPLHAGVVDGCSELFFSRVAGRAVVRVQNPLRLDDGSEPEPDVLLARPRRDRYKAAHPGPADVLLLIEVADTTVQFDRQRKLPLYARAGVPESWLLIVDADALEVHRQPSGRGYQVVQRFGRNDVVTPEAFPDLELRVADLLGEQLSDTARP
jgi:Uma2 family endonuclease